MFRSDTLPEWRLGTHTRLARGRLDTLNRQTHSRWGLGTHTWLMW